MLSGAGLFEGSNDKYQVHCTATAVVDNTGAISLEDTISTTAPVFVMAMEDGSLGKMLTGTTVSGQKITLGESDKTTYANKQVFVDYYVEKTSGVTELQIDAANFAGYYYVEASTLFRREADGKDLPAEIVFPRVKVQSNFTFNMASTGDPSELMRLAA